MVGSGMKVSRQCWSPNDFASTLSMLRDIEGGTCSSGDIEPFHLL